MNGPCQWCDQPATVELVLIPTVQTTTSKNGILKPGKPAVTAWACEKHATIRDREPGAPPQDPRRRKAKGVKQLDIFDALRGG